MVFVFGFVFFIFFIFGNRFRACDTAGRAQNEGPGGPSTGLGRLPSPLALSRARWERACEVGRKARHSQGPKPFAPGWLAGWPLLGGALAGGTAGKCGTRPGTPRCDPVGQSPGARRRLRPLGGLSVPSARSGRGGSGSAWDGYCVEFDFSWPAWGKLVSPGTVGIIYREPANQTQQSNLTFPSPRKFLQLGATAR